MFKVVPDQLRISEGWVRCGQCNEIFDAAAQMQGGDAQGPETVPMVSHDAAEPPVQASSRLDMELADDDVHTESLVEEAVSTRAALSGGSAYGQVEPTMGNAFLPTESMGSTPGRLFDPVAADAESAPQELSFMRGSRATSRWTRTWVRVCLVLISLALGLLLAAQLAVNERDRIAAVEPRVKPWIEELCSFAECTVAPLKQIESVVIDSSSFNKIRGDVYRLNFSLKNTAPIELALPAIELSLTDVHDQPLMRRVFEPDELGIKSGVLQAATESNTSLTLGIKNTGGADRIAGYRILAFYP
jgi:predicted Zn finger-like uncharacterized protein